MPATHYKIWQFGNPVGSGVTGSYHVGIAGVAKHNTADLPYAVANELICSYLAKILMLPVPPGFVVEHDGAPYFVSLNFNLAGEDLPPVNPSQVVQDCPEVSAGIVLFDAWVVNPDRHRENIAYDPTTRKVQIFDHGHAFFSGSHGMAFLENHRDQLGIGSHCLVSVLPSFDGIHHWSERINQVPEYYIRGVLAAATQVGLPDGQVNAAVDFLLERRNRLLALVRENREVFSSVQQALWDGLER